MSILGHRFIILIIAFSFAACASDAGIDGDALDVSDVAADVASDVAADVADDGVDGVDPDGVVADIDANGDADGQSDTGMGEDSDGGDVGDTGDDIVLGDTMVGDTGAGDTGAGDTGAGDDTSGPGTTFRFRAMAANLTTNSQLWNAPGERILQGLDPDVVLIQEFNVNSSMSEAAVAAWVKEIFGPDFEYTRGAGTLPNGVVSRYPILAEGEWDDPEISNRGFTWARIDLPGDRELHAISVHLKAGSSDSGTRRRQAEALTAFIEADVVDTDYLVLGGDFNTVTRGETCVLELASVMVTAGPYPVDLLVGGSGNTNKSRSKPYDWVIAGPDLDAREVPTPIGDNSFTDGFVLDTRVYTPIEDVAPALSGDSAAASMQHMAVVREFEVFVPAATGDDANSSTP